MYQKYIKRLFDIVLSGIAIIVLSPILIITAILVKTKLGSPVLFTQKRPGKNEKIFKMYKFRTMTNQKNRKGKLLSDQTRLTPFGKWLRATSIDELPELINIFKGDMSIVGPRPLLVKYLRYYNTEQKHRHDVKPGLTGLAQVNGRNAISWEDKFKYDVEYVNNVSLGKDMKIIMCTVKKVIEKDDINSETCATMEYFTGSK